ncbi:DUF2325 domain-containing protein [Anaerobacillus isosaccharinicus]|uniref:DUF2325 domain-containing protein n=1 Tax=Anaerobacillus isosaccharinicus TaxID=1532552 RepID=A0A1S2KYD8_9BACI|nr:DUF2325 domain-containing protein [Anaerobacillus isosaccharinicus]QOY37688.1 DUF2325 domain-containing protein [Anaerobacillus isosaccharinicus]
MSSRKTMAIIGGTQERTMRKIAGRVGYELIFDDANSHRAKETKYKSIVENADVIVVMTGACSHKAMWLIKSLAKEVKKPIVFNKNGFGVSGAIQLGVNAIETSKLTNV